jgi:NADPH-dependent curcumin reductase CurA
VQIWEDVSKNIIVDQGLEYLIDVALAEATQEPTWWCGIVYDTPTFSATGTIGSHAGWTEVTTYSAADRPQFNVLDNGVGSVDNDSSTAVAAFTLSVSLTVGGVFLISTATNTGAGGVIFSGVAFSGGNRAVQTADRLEVTYTLSVADA